MRFDLTRALTRRILHGDIRIERDGEKSFVPYDTLQVRRNGDSLSIELRAGKLVLAYLDMDMSRFHNGESLTINDLRGRMELTMTGTYDEHSFSDVF